MTSEEHERMIWLCKRIQEEQDLKTFNKLVLELDELFETKEQRLELNTGNRA
jgi:hypothetical protein